MMHSEWRLQEAQGNFGQLVKQAANGDAQMVTVHGKPAVVVISAETYAQFTHRKGKLSDALLQPELDIEDLDLSLRCESGRKSPRTPNLPANRCR